MVSINAAFSVTDEIYSGVKVGDIDVGGLTVQAAEKKIASAFREKVLHAPVTLTYQDQKWSITAAEIGLNMDIPALAREAYDVGRKGNSFHQLQEKYLAFNRGHMVPLALNYDATKISSLLTEIARSIDRSPVNAALTSNKSDITINPESIGYRVDIAKTLAGITEGLQSRIPFSLPLVVEEVAPAIKAKDLEGINGIIASYSTQFNPSDKNRSQNVALAAKSVNGVLVKRGETFSFNQYVGPRLAQYGYKVAPVFINGKLTPDWGGGVCQVSSTIYNAALLADLTVVERTSHYRPPGYVPLGQDATVADNQLDFRFKNTSSHNIYITSEINDNQLVVSIYGQLSSNPPEILVVAADRKVMEPNTVVRQDAELELGKQVIEVEGQKGFQVTTYRVKYNNGKELSRELLATDEFPPEDRIVRIGTKTPVKRPTK